MKRNSIILLQSVVVFIGIVTLAILIRFPLTEGRAVNLDLFSIYFDPFILYGYAAFITFFVGLYQVFKLLGYFRQDKVFSLNSVRTLKSIKQCAIAFGILIAIAGLYIKLFHDKQDDPVGFLAMCIVTTFGAIVVATIAGTFQRKLQRGVDINLSTNDIGFVK